MAELVLTRHVIPLSLCISSEKAATKTESESKDAADLLAIYAPFLLGADFELSFSRKLCFTLYPLLFLRPHDNISGL
jgi:hypothetical protein